MRIAIVGAGVMGRRHADVAAGIEDVEIVAFVDADPCAGAATAAYRVPLHASLDEMLDRVRPDGAIVATPTQTHAEIGHALIARGVPVLLEKPITDDVGAGRRLVEAAEVSGVPVAIGHHRRFDPAVRIAHDLIRGGRIGRLLLGTVVWAQRKPEPYFEVAWRRQKGGGPILTNLIHEVDLLRHFCGEVESVYAETSNAVRGFEVEDTAAILFRFSGGARVSVVISDAAQTPWSWERATGENPEVPAMGLDPYRFIGTEGGLDFPSNDLWTTPSAGGGTWWDPLARTDHVVRSRAAHRDQLAQFARVCRGLEVPMVSAADGLASLAATLAVSRSAEEGRPVAPEYRL
jgi:predicted dehydrogenase